MREDLTPVNYSSGRSNKILGICIHTTVGSYQGTINWFKNPNANVSAHYVIKEDGSEVTRMVKESDTAWTQGIKYGVSSELVKEMGSANPNSYLIGIECADGGNPHNHDRTGQYQALKELVNDICDRHDIAKDRKHIIGHKEIRSSKTCPGNIDVDHVVKLLQGDNMSELDKVREMRDRNWRFLTSIIKEIFPEKSPNDETIKNDVEQARSKIAEFEKELETAKSSITGFKGEITKRNNRIEELEKELEQAKNSKPSLIGKRKLIAGISAALIVIISKLAGKYLGIEISPQELWIAVSGSLAYIGVEGSADFVSRVQEAMGKRS